MSERITFSEIPRRYKIGAAIGALVLALSLNDGFSKSEQGSFMNKVFMEDSKVVAGVPAQVHKNYDDAGIYNRFSANLMVEVEQCYADIEAAKAGKPEQRSFDPSTKIVAPGCFKDEVLVWDYDFWNSLKPGSVVLFPGSPAEHMDKRTDKTFILF